MCGRITIINNQQAIESRFKAKFNYKFQPRFNAAPAQELPVILNYTPDVINKVRWGLMPKWIREAKVGGGIINIRVESLKSKPTFKADLKNRRCLASADVFYKWNN